MFCLVDDKGVIYKPEPKGSGVGEGIEGLDHQCHLGKFLYIICYFNIFSVT